MHAHAYSPYIRTHTQEVLLTVCSFIMRPLMELLVGVWGCNGDGRTEGQEEGVYTVGGEGVVRVLWDEVEGGLRVWVREGDMGRLRGMCLYRDTVL